jgi:hypothetical protein
MTDTKAVPPGQEKKVLASIGKGAKTAIVASGKAVAWVATTVPVISHVLSAIYISLRDWHVAVCWALLMCGVYFFATMKADEDWRQVVANLKSANTTLSRRVTDFKCPAAPVCQASPAPASAAPTAAPDAPKASTPAKKKRASTGLFGSLFK